MRWEPIPGAEIGTWSDTPLARESAKPAPVSPLVSAGLLPASAPRAGPLGPRPVGGPGIEPRAADIVAVTARFEGVLAAARVWRTGRRLRKEQRPSGKLVRWSVGVDVPSQGLAISLWRDGPHVGDDALGLLTDELHANWAMCWQPADYEIGQWSGLRMRSLSRRHSSDRVVSG